MISVKMIQALLDRHQHIRLCRGDLLNGEQFLNLRCPQGHEFKVKYRLLKGVRKNAASGGCSACKGTNQSKRLAQGLSATERATQACKDLGLVRVSFETLQNKEDFFVVKGPCGHEFKTRLWILNNAKKTGSLAKGCPKCHRKSRQTVARHEFLKELEEFGYDVLDPYVDARTRIRIRRRSDGEFNHITRLAWNEGKRWLKPQSKLLTKETMQADLDVRKPGYEVVDASRYRNKYCPVTVRCAGLNEKKERHTYTTYWQTIQYFPCKQCSGAFQSHEEVNFRKGIQAHYPAHTVQTQWSAYSIKDPKHPRKSFDLFFPEKNLVIEYCGLYFHSSRFKRPTEHANKLKLAELNGYRLLTVFEDEWKQKPRIVLSRIGAILGESKRLYARECTLRVLEKKESRAFFEENHLQGSTAERICFGLFCGEDLVGATSFGPLSRSPESQSTTIELKRMAFLCGFTVVGGASKMLKAAEAWLQVNGYDKIVSFADLRWSRGDIYRTLGFSQVGTPRPSRQYFKARQRWNAQTLKLKPEERNLGKTESELRAEQGYSVIYDCGHQRWEKRLK